MAGEYGLKKLNAYDIFANIIPGLVFIFGLLLPLRPVPVLEAIFGETWSPSLGIPQLLLLLVVSFVCGQMLQTIGGRVDGDHGFANLMRRIRGEDVECRYSLSEFEDGFWENCRNTFQLTDDFESYDRLFKAVLAYLEDQGKYRALRMQALYLFSRGVVIALRVLATIYIIAFIALIYNIIPESEMFYFRSESLMFLGGIVAYILSLYVDGARRELEEDWIKYSITESHLSMVEA